MMSSLLDDVVVVGGGLAGARVCEELRRRGHRGSITLIGGEPHLPYDRPPLSKSALHSNAADTTLDVQWQALDVELRLDTIARELLVDQRKVVTDGGVLDFDSLVIATGSTPITLPGPGRQLTLRRPEDAAVLRDALGRQARVCIVGASWIGAEVATAAIDHGCAVTCVESAPTVLHGALGTLGFELESWWQDVDLRLESPVDQIITDGVLLSDGTVVDADIVVCGIGARPEVSWLAGSGLDVAGGVRVDQHLAAAPGVVAVGDVARYRSMRFGSWVRVEHWDNAGLAAGVAASTLLEPEAGAVHDPLPYFWSEQFGRRLQYVGRHSPSDQLVLRGTPKASRWSAVWVDADERLTAAVTVGSPREFNALRRLVDRTAVVDVEKLADEQVPLDAGAPRKG